jgi:hypothetical protein
MADESPGIVFNEKVEDMYPRGSGASTILIYGKTPDEEELDKVYNFSNYPDALDEFGPEATGNELLQAIKDVFIEGQKRPDTSDVLGVDQVFAINMGASPSAQDWTDAMATADKEQEIELELFAKISDLAVMNSCATRYDTIKVGGEFREGFFTLPEDTTIANAVLYTDPTVVAPATYIRDSNILIHYDPNIQAKFVSKCACNYYYNEPTLGAYRTVTAEQITKMKNADLQTLIQGGINCDMVSRESFNGVRMAESVKAVATSFREVTGARPNDSLLHRRRNADRQFRMAVDKARAELKLNNTDNGLKVIKEVIEGELKIEKEKDRLKSYTVNTYPVSDDANAVKVQMSVSPEDAVYKIIFDAVVTA